MGTASRCIIKPTEHVFRDCVPRTGASSANHRRRATMYEVSAIGEGVMSGNTCSDGKHVSLLIGCETHIVEGLISE